MIPQGQLSQVERQYLYDTVIKLEPQIVLESGTWYGGGSTYWISEALKRNNCGVLMTYETHEPFYRVAKEFYKENSYVACFLADFNESIKDFDGKLIDMVFLDGGDETPEGKLKLPYGMYPEYSENLAAFKILEKKLKSGAHVLCHDWSIEGGRGSFIKSYLEKKNFKGWNLINVNNATTGLAHLIKL